MVPLLFHRENMEETGRIQALYQRLCDFIETNGYQHGRCCTPYMDQIPKINPGYSNLLQKIRKAVDPIGILSPGRYGVW